MGNGVLLRLLNGAGMCEGDDTARPGNDSVYWASIRGGPNQAAFASAKHGLRAVSRSFARELGPQGIHVAHVVMDGPIKGKFASERVSHYDARLARDEVLLPDDIGRFYVELHNQPRSAWVYQADLRPWTEKWDW